MKKTFFKVLALTLTLVMAMSIAVQAAPALVKNDAVDGVVTVNVTDVAATDEVTLLVVKAGTALSDVVADDIYYIDQATAVDGAALFSFAIDTEEFDVYSGYSSMAVDSLPLSSIYEVGGDDPVVPDDPEGPVVDEAASKLYTSKTPYGLTGYRRVFIKLTEENGAWTPTHADADSAIFYAPEVEGYDGLVKTTSEDLTAILDEITWANEAPSAEATIAQYGNADETGAINIVDSANVMRNVKKAVDYSLRQYLTADVDDNTTINIVDSATIMRYIKKAITEFATVTNK